MLRRTARLLGEVSRAEAAYQTVLTGLWQARDLGVNRIEMLVSDPDVAAQLGGDAAVPSSLIGVSLQVRAILRAYRWKAVTPVDSLRTAEAAAVARRARDRNVDEANFDSLPTWIASHHAWVTSGRPGMSRTASTIEVDSKRTASTSRDGRRHATVRLRSSAALTPEMLLEVAARVRRALRLIGVTDVSIDIESDNATDDTTSR